MKKRSKPKSLLLEWLVIFHLHGRRAIWRIADHLKADSRYFVAWQKTCCYFVRTTRPANLLPSTPVRGDHELTLLGWLAMTNGEPPLPPSPPPIISMWRRVFREREKCSLEDLPTPPQKPHSPDLSSTIPLPLKKKKKHKRGRLHELSTFLSASFINVSSLCLKFFDKICFWFCFLFYCCTHLHKNLAA